MLVQRGQLLAKLNEAVVGVKTDEGVEQSNCFTFRDGVLTTFNDTVMVRVPTPLPGIDCVVNATDLMGLLAKVPDEDLDIKLREGELLVKGKRRRAGIAVQSEFLLPVNEVPRPTAWVRLPEGVNTALQQAAKTCEKKDADFLYTTVNVTPEWVEGADGDRMLRVTTPTGFTEQVLLPADGVAALEGMELQKVCQEPGWVHFKTAQVSLRSSSQEYIKGVEGVLAIEGHNITLPANLGEILERAEVCNSGGYDNRVGLAFEDDELYITARKEGVWYKEQKAVAYQGPPLAFEVNPKLLREVLRHTRDVVVDQHKMKIEYDRHEFIIVVRYKSEARIATPEDAQVV
jgi:hypothetical protein